ncbi:DUF2065 domain-containing protein [Pseudochrobactrum sp. HB0163]|uniref:DUF2065 domain-containing protein n=1 Tax=Pseudochrobactrum sp. HB0163 TaxID=3450708 RepID=UPI003F6E4331
MQDFITALGLLLVIEGVLYGGFPQFARRMAKDVSEVQDTYLRSAGIAALALGVGVIWMIRG